MGGTIPRDAHGRGRPRRSTPPDRGGAIGLRRVALALGALLMLVASFVTLGCGGARLSGQGASGATTGTERFMTEAQRLAPTTGHFSICPDCHAFLDPPEADRPFLTDAFRHETHLERGAACEDCHPAPVHTEQGIRRPGMAQCFTCHGQDPAAKAPGDCGLCHPPDMPLEPSSHTDEFFAGGHAAVVATQGTEECFVCHEGDEETFCTGCHGLQMPHPEGWLTTGPDPGEHVDWAYQDARVCTRCHQNTDEPAPPGCYQGECHGG